MRRSILLITAAAVIVTAQAVPAAEPAWSKARAKQCLLAKYGHGGRPPCEPPRLPDDAGAQEVVAVRLARARFFNDMEEPKTAVSEVDEALKLAPDGPAVRHLAGQLAMALGDMARAERELAHAMRLAPDDVEIRVTNAARLEMQPAPYEALRQFSEILAARPDHTASREARVRLLLSLGHHREAIADLDVLLAAHSDVNNLSRRAVARIALSEPELAVADFTAALRQEPNRLILLIGRAMAHELAGNDDAALQDYNAILGPVGGKPNYAIGEDFLAKHLAQRAFLFVRLKRFEDAASDMAEALHRGGRPAVLRVQVFLRQNGFRDIPLDGRDSGALRTALQACLRLNACFDGISHAL